MGLFLKHPWKEEPTSVCLSLFPGACGHHMAEFSEAVIEVFVEATEMMGSETYLYLKAGESDMIARVEPTTQAKGGDVVRIALNMRNCHIFDRDTEINLTL